MIATEIQPSSARVPQREREGAVWDDNSGGLDDAGRGTR